MRGHGAVAQARAGGRRAAVAVEEEGGGGGGGGLRLLVADGRYSVCVCVREGGCVCVERVLIVFIEKKGGGGGGC